MLHFADAALRIDHILFIVLHCDELLLCDIYVVVFRCDIQDNCTKEIYQTVSLITESYYCFYHAWLFRNNFNQVSNSKVFDRLLRILFYLSNNKTKQKKQDTKVFYGDSIQVIEAFLFADYFFVILQSFNMLDQRNSFKFVQKLHKLKATIYWWIIIIIDVQ
jgi:hypothetical protein